MGGKLSAEIASLTVKRQLAWFAATPSFNLLCARAAGRRGSSRPPESFQSTFHIFCFFKSKSLLKMAWIVGRELYLGFVDIAFLGITKRTLYALLCFVFHCCWKPTLSLSVCYDNISFAAVVSKSTL